MFSIKLVLLYCLNFHSASIRNIHHWNGSVAAVWRENTSSAVAKLSSKTDSLYHYDYSNLQEQSSYEIDNFFNTNEHILIQDYNVNSSPVIDNSKLQKITPCTYLHAFFYFLTSDCSKIRWDKCNQPVFGQHYVMTCTLETNFCRAYTWKKYSTIDMTQPSNFSNDVLFIDNDQTWYVDAFSEVHNGMYTCECLTPKGRDTTTLFLSASGEQ